VKARAPLVALALAVGSSVAAGATAPPARGLVGDLLDSGRRAGLGLLGAAWQFLEGRTLDLIDVGEFDIGIGPGLKAGLEYGVARTTLGLVEAQRIGFDGRQVGTWMERNASFGILPASLVFAPFELVRRAGEPWRSLALYGFEMGSLGAERTQRRDFVTTAVLYHEARAAGPWHERPGDIAAVGAELHLFLIGARARLKPLEALDFLLGFIGLDLDPRLAHPQERSTRLFRPRTIEGGILQNPR